MTTASADDIETIDMGEELAERAAEPPDPARYYHPLPLGENPVIHTEQTIDNIVGLIGMADKNIVDMEAALALARMDRERLAARLVEYQRAWEMLTSAPVLAPESEPAAD